MPPENSSVWWVNQGQSYSRAIAGSYLWAPKRNKDGHTFVHWTSMARLAPGDRVIHYANGAIRAISRVTAAARDAERPEEEADSQWEKDGLLVEVAPNVLPSPVSLASLPESLRAPGLGPFTAMGSVKQGYLWELPETLAEGFRSHFAATWPKPGPGDPPDPSAPPSSSTAASRHEIYDFLETQGFRFPEWLVTDYILVWQPSLSCFSRAFRARGRRSLLNWWPSTLRPREPTYQVVGESPDAGLDGFVQRGFGMSTFKYGITSRDRRRGYFLTWSPGRGLTAPSRARG